MHKKSKLFKKPKRLFFDIETSPNIGVFWSAGYKQMIDYENIIKERAIICIAYKWEDGPTHHLEWDSKQDDKIMLEKFIKIANEADEIIGHNCDKFDIAWIRTRCLYHRIPMFPSYVSVDTLKVSRSKFRFNSNRLNYISQYLGIGKKISTKFDLWKDVLLKNDRSALKKMVKYCEGDVRLLEKVYKAMGVHIQPKSSVASNKGECPECGSSKNIVCKTRKSAQGIIRVQYQCKECGKYHTGPTPSSK